MTIDGRASRSASATGWRGCCASSPSCAAIPTASARPRSPGGSGVATRTVYRDLRALETEVGVAVWSEDGLWGVVGEEFLPPLKLTLDEAMAVVLSARLMVRYADKYDPDLAAAFEKLEEVLPRPLAEHVERTLDVLAQHPRDAAFSEHVHRLTRAWAERRVVTLEYEPARYAPGCRRPPGRRPPLPDRAVAADPRPVPDRLGRDARRAAHLQDRADPGRRPDAADRSSCPRAMASRAPLRRAWDIIADQPPTDVVLRFTPDGRGPRAGGDLAPDPARRASTTDGSLTWRATVAGTIEIRLWILSWGDDVEVLEPPETAKRRCLDAPSCGRAVRGAGTGAGRLG